MLNTSTVRTRAFDWRNLHSIYSSVHDLQYSSISSDHVPSMHTSPYTKAYNASLMVMICLHNIESPHNFPVIFISGDTLAINPSEDNFVGLIVPFQIECRLGGMAGSVPITGIGLIIWRGNKLLVFHLMCYRVPTAKLDLLALNTFSINQKELKGLSHVWRSMKYYHSMESMI